MPTSIEPPSFAVADAVARALAEDLTPLGDLTSALLAPGLDALAEFVARDAGTLAGRACAQETFRQVDPALAVTWSADDGDELAAGQAFGEVYGSLASILTAERTALNFVSHLSGIATVTASYVAAVREVGDTVRIWDTRKTTPGLRTLEKAAVRAGGGANHRGNLSDWILVKDNHLAVMSVSDAVASARALWPARTVHIECDTLAQVREAAEAGADALLLDNMTVDEVEEATRLTAQIAAATGNRRPLLEVSGGVTLDSVRVLARLDIDCISVGRITNSAPVLDIGLDITTKTRS